MQISATDRVLSWAALRDGAIVVAGVTVPGDTTASAELVSAESEPALLGALVSSEVAALPLPDVGEWVEAGSIYEYAGGLVMVRQSHTRQHNPDDPGVGALYGVYRPGVDVWEWVAGEVLQVGARRSYEGVVYELYRDIGANNWSPPPQVAAHWRVVVESEPETPPAWVQPTGAHDAYNIGDRVAFEGNIYESLVDANVWSPTAYPRGWQLIGPA